MEFDNEIDASYLQPLYVGASQVDKARANKLFEEQDISQYVVRRGLNGIPIIELPLDDPPGSTGEFAVIEKGKYIPYRSLLKSRQVDIEKLEQFVIKQAQLRGHSERIRQY